MKKYIVLAMVILLMVGFSVSVSGKPEFLEETVNPSNGNAVVSIPEKAVEVTPGVFDLGYAIDEQSGKLVKGYAIITYKKGYGKPGTVCGNGVCEPSENVNKCPVDCSDDGEDPPSDTCSCYDFIGKGVKWKRVEPYVINPSNNDGLDNSIIVNNFDADIDKWETAAGTDIIGTGSTTTVTLVADTESTDGMNEVYFGILSDSNAIAVTIVWGVFYGPPGQRELVEWDQVYNTYYTWSISGEANKMDFENIATHELGHSVGLDDLYTSECSDQTMYGYASYGETDKRTLECGDITGVQSLYS